MDTKQNRLFGSAGASHRRKEEDPEKARVFHFLKPDQDAAAADLMDVINRTADKEAKGADGGIWNNLPGIIGAVGQGVSSSIAAANNKSTTTTINQHTTYESDTKKWIAIAAAAALVIIVVLVLVFCKRS